jgi:hypothetical protein
MRSILSLFVISMFLILGSSTILAVTIVVDHAGGGDYLTIGEAYDAALGGEEILIRPGTYPEYVEVVKSLDFVADGAPGSVVWDGEGTHRIAKVGTAIQVTMTGIEFRNGFDGLEDGCGVAIHINGGAHLDIDQCRFIDNYANWDSAVYAGLSGTYVKITDTLFEGNYAYHNAPATGVLLGAVMEIKNCVFRDNTCDSICGAVAAWHADLVVNDCLFEGNVGGTAGALRILYGSIFAYNNTFHDNSGSAVAHLYPDSYSSFDHNIVTTNPVGDGLSSTDVMHACNLYYDIDGVEVLEGLAPDEIVEDPLYCDYTIGDFHLCYTSPALPENNDCGQMGAFAMGCTECGPIANDDRTWGEVKMLFD